MRKVFLDDLPRKYGFGANKDKLITDWNSSIGYTIHFIYDDIEGDLKIINYNSPFITFIYKNKTKTIRTGELRESCLGELLNKYTSNFKVKIGTIFKDDKRDLTITDREYRYDKRDHKWKWYKYTCNLCGWTGGWMTEGALLNNTGCSCCWNKIAVEGINDIPTTAPWMIPYFQGGYDEAKKYTKTGGGNPNNRSGKIHPICPDCGRIKDKSIDICDIYQNHSIGCVCRDGFPYPEKILYSIFEQLNIDFKTQLSKTTFKWCDKYKYDFYIINTKIIVEVHGEQHYSKGFNTCGGKTLEQEQENDRVKKQLALNNGIKEEDYIVIDCRHSELDFIKNNILNSKLGKLFDLSKIDWLKAGEFALSNRVKEVCQVWETCINPTTADISKITNIERQLVVRYLKKGAKLGWCNYDPKKEVRKSASKNGKKKGKSVICVNTGHIFNSVRECSAYMKNTIGVKISDASIFNVCNNKRINVKGYSFKFCS